MMGYYKVLAFIWQTMVDVLMKTIAQKIISSTPWHMGVCQEVLNCDIPCVEGTQQKLILLISFEIIILMWRKRTKMKFMDAEE